MHGRSNDLDRTEVCCRSAQTEGRRARAAGAGVVAKGDGAAAGRGGVAPTAMPLVMDASAWSPIAMVSFAVMPLPARLPMAMVAEPVTPTPAFTPRAVLSAPVTLTPPPPPTAVRSVALALLPQGLVGARKFRAEASPAASAAMDAPSGKTDRRAAGRALKGYMFQPTTAARRGPANRRKSTQQPPALTTTSCSIDRGARLKVAIDS